MTTERSGRRRRFAPGSRVVAAGLSASATLALAGAMARAESSAAENETLLPETFLSAKADLSALRVAAPLELAAPSTPTVSVSSGS